MKFLWLSVSIIYFLNEEVELDFLEGPLQLFICLFVCFNTLWLKLLPIIEVEIPTLSDLRMFYKIFKILKKGISHKNLNFFKSPHLVLAESCYL